IRRAAPSEGRVLITGENGTGKELIARAIHAHSPRKGGPFVKLNCAAVPHELIESELFGHEKGAFTGAVASKQGLFEVAHAGTLFLDEIGDVDPALQPKLLKVVEEKRFRRLGEVSDRTVDVRLIGATHHDLEAMARDGRFRSDLYFRISTIPLTIPALRERPEDIPLLSTQILDRVARTVGRRNVTISPAAMRELVGYPWPGNVRELRNAIERALLLAEGNVLEPSDFALRATRATSNHGDDLRLTLEEMERKHIERVLADEGGRVDRAAERLAVPRSSLYQKLKRYGIR
ncbi:MAG TPA: sigma-54 dependent transcriptional regulator, partial [Thermoanaerobaculia bacterium]